MKKKKETFSFRGFLKVTESLDDYTGMLRVFANMLSDDVQKTDNMDIGRIQGIVGILDEVADDLAESVKTARILLKSMVAIILLLLCIIVF